MPSVRGHQPPGRCSAAGGPHGASCDLWPIYFFPVPLHAEQLTQFPKSLCPPDPPQRGHAARRKIALITVILAPRSETDSDMRMQP
jgi:hypothetical protein